MWQGLRAHRGLVTFVTVYYIGFLVLGASTGNSQTAFYGAFLAVAFLAVARWHQRRPFSKLVLWGLAIWGLLHMAGGLIPVEADRVLYNVQLLPVIRFDQVVHAIGFGFAGLAFLEYATPTLSIGSGANLAFFGGLGFGAINEMIEFLITRIVPETNIGGFENTGWDLVANTIGAALAAAWVHSRWATEQRRTK